MLWHFLLEINDTRLTKMIIFSPLSVGLIYSVITFTLTFHLPVRTKYSNWVSGLSVKIVDSSGGPGMLISPAGRDSTGDRKVPPNWSLIPYSPHSIFLSLHVSSCLCCHDNTHISLFFSTLSCNISVTNRHTWLHCLRSFMLLQPRTFFVCVCVCVCVCA